MKKLTVIVALALLAVAGTGYAVTCAYDNVPGATLLIPYFKVSGPIDANGYIDASSGTDTKVSFVNVSTPGIIAHVTIWNKYSKATLDFNVPMTGKDVVSFSMKDVLNGKLNVNKTAPGLVSPVISPLLQTPGQKDVCGLNLTNGTYNATPYVGWGQQQYLRMPHPQAGAAGTVPTALDPSISVSIYQEPDAFKPLRANILSSLDESADITSFNSVGALGGGIIDKGNYACDSAQTATAADLKGAFEGYITVDVVNFCTNWFPDQAEFYDYDAIATSGWGPTYTPNVLIGDVFFVDQTPDVGNISGDPAVALEFDTRLEWNVPAAAPDTFFGRFVDLRATACEQSGGCANLAAAYAAFQFGGDGREPLGDRYGYRYLNQAGAVGALQTWITVWRGDITYARSTGAIPQQNLCQWLLDGQAALSNTTGYGFMDANHALVVSTFDNDEQSYTVVACPPGYPSPCPQGAPPTTLYVFLESSRIALLGNTQINPGGYIGGWSDVQFRSNTYNGTTPLTGLYNQAFVGVQHSGPGVLLNVGLSATNLNNNFNCAPPVTGGYGTPPAGNVP